MDAQAVGQRIKAAREAKGLTQEGLAALVDLSPTHVSVIERGLKIPNLDSFVAIANALGVSADSLLIDVVDHADADHGDYPRKTRWGCIVRPAFTRWCIS